MYVSRHDNIKIIQKILLEKVDANRRILQESEFWSEKQMALPKYPSITWSNTVVNKITLITSKNVSDISLQVRLVHNFSLKLVHFKIHFIRTTFT